MKISEILRKAADEHLWEGTGNYYASCRYSCDAIDLAVGYYYDKMSTVKNYLRELGLGYNPEEELQGEEPLTQFAEFEYGEERQGARYAWLMFAADIAEEEGL